MYVLLFHMVEEELASLQEAEIILSDPDLIAPIYKQLSHVKWIQSTWAGKFILGYGNGATTNDNVG